MPRIDHQPTQPAQSMRKTHWVVHMNHRNRTGVFLLLGTALALHIWPQSPTVITWVLFGLTFGIYPQIAWWLGQRSSHPMQQEVWHMRLDALCFGAWTAGLHFPVWVGFALLMGSTLNLVLFRGLTGGLESLVAWAIACVIVGITMGWQIEPHTSWPVTAILAATLMLYMMVAAMEIHRRSMHLHQTRQLLKTQRKELLSHLEEIECLQAQLKEQALRDALTGLYNRHNLIDVFARELNQCLRITQPLTLVLIDIDHFKNINDTLGHQMGDEVLRQVADVLHSGTRANDWCFRYGGEEFLLLLPETSFSQGWEKIDRLRLHLAQTTLKLGHQPWTVTLSAGVSSYPQDGDNLNILLQVADEALYQAKAEGRNKVLPKPDTIAIPARAEVT